MNNLYKHTSYYQRGGPSYGGDYNNQRPQQNNGALRGLLSLPPQFEGAPIQRTNIKVGGLLSENDLFTGSATSQTSIEQIQADRATYNREAIYEALNISFGNRRTEGEYQGLTDGERQMLRAAANEQPQVDPEIKQRLSDISTFVKEMVNQINQSDYNTSLQLLQSYQSQMQQFFLHPDIQRYLKAADYLAPTAGRGQPRMQRPGEEPESVITTLYGRPREDMIDTSILGDARYTQKIAGYRNMRNYAQLMYLDLKEIVMSKMNSSNAVYPQQYPSQNLDNTIASYGGYNIEATDVGGQSLGADQPLTKELDPYPSAQQTIQDGGTLQEQTPGNQDTLAKTMETVRMNEDQFVEKAEQFRVQRNLWDVFEKWKETDTNQLVQATIQKIEAAGFNGDTIGHLQTLMRTNIDKNSRSVALFLTGMLQGSGDNIRKAWTDADDTYRQKMTQWIS